MRRPALEDIELFLCSICLIEALKASFVESCTPDRSRLNLEVVRHRPSFPDSQMFRLDRFAARQIALLQMMIGRCGKVMVPLWHQPCIYLKRHTCTLKAQYEQATVILLENFRTYQENGCDGYY